MAEGPILIDVSATGDAGYARSFLEKIDHPTMLCTGPGGGICPILQGDHCEMLESARGVVYELDLDIPQHREILSRYQDLLEDDVPVRVVIKPGQEKTHADLLRGVRVWSHEPSIGELDGFAAEVEAADRQREAEAGE